MSAQNKEFEQRAQLRDHDLDELFRIVRAMDARQLDLTQRFTLHMNVEEQHYARTNKELTRLADEVQSLTALHRAFPELDDGTPDLDGHREDHVERRDAARSSSQFWGVIKQDAARYLVMAIMTATLVVFGLGVKGWVEQTFHVKVEVTK